MSSIINGVINALPGPLSSLGYRAKNALSRNISIRSSTEGRRNPHAPSDNDHDEDNKSKNSSSSSSKSSHGSSNNVAKSLPKKKTQPKRQKKQITIHHCDKCMKDEEEKVVASHFCSECNIHYCEAHTNLHNSANKTKSHVPNVTEVSGGKTVPINYITDLKKVEELGQKEEGNFKFDYPNCIAIDSGYGSLFVADGPTIFEFDLTTKTLVNHFQEPQDRRPCRLCYDPNDDTLVYGIDRCGAWDVVKLSRDGKCLQWEASNQAPIHDMFVDREDGTVYTVQHDGIVFIKDGAVVNTLREDLTGNNMFIDIGYDSIVGVSQDHNNNLIILSRYKIFTTNKKGKILKKGEKVNQSYSHRVILDPTGEKIFFVGDSDMESLKLNGTCRMVFNDKGGDDKFSIDRGEGIDIAIDFSTGEVYVVNISTHKVVVYKEM